MADLTEHGSASPPASPMISRPVKAPESRRVQFFETERLFSDARNQGGHRAMPMSRNGQNQESYDRRTPHMSVLLGQTVAPIQPQPTTGPRVRRVEPGTHQRTQQALRERMKEMLGEFITRNPEVTEHINSEGLPEHLLAPHIEYAETLSDAQKEFIREEQREIVREHQRSSGEIYEIDEEFDADAFDKVDRGNQFLRKISDCLSETDGQKPESGHDNLEHPRPTSIGKEPWIEPKIMSHHLNRLPRLKPPPSKQLNPVAWPKLDQAIKIVPMNAPSSPVRTRRPTAKRAAASADQVPKLVSKPSSPRRKRSTTEKAMASADQVEPTTPTKASSQERKATLPTLKPTLSPTKRVAPGTPNDEPQKRRKTSAVSLREEHTSVAAQVRSARKPSAKDVTNYSFPPAPPRMRSPSLRGKTASIASTPEPEDMFGKRQKSPTLKLHNPDAKRFKAEKARMEQGEAEAAAALLSLNKTEDTTPYNCVCRYKDTDGGDAVQCDQCDTWQHVVCFYKDGTSLANQSHYCLDCKPRYLGDLSTIYARQDQIRGLPSLTDPSQTAPRRREAPKRRTVSPRTRAGKETENVSQRNNERKLRKRVDDRDDQEKTAGRRD